MRDNGGISVLLWGSWDCWGVGFWVLVFKRGVLWGYTIHI